MNAAYWRTYRAEHPQYRERERQRSKRKGHPERAALGARMAEYAKRPSRAVPGLVELFPDLVRGAVLTFWREELTRDLRQEAALAEIEGRDVQEAVRAYSRRESTWFRLTTELPETR